MRFTLDMIVFLGYPPAVRPSVWDSMVQLFKTSDSSDGNIILIMFKSSSLAEAEHSFKRLSSPSICAYERKTNVKAHSNNKKKILGFFKKKLLLACFYLSDNIFFQSGGLYTQCKICYSTSTAYFPNLSCHRLIRQHDALD